MLNVTDRAREFIARALEIDEAKEREALRIYLTEEGDFEMGLDEAHDNDLVVEHDGRPLVLVDPEVSWELDGATLDAQESDEGLDLMLELPEIEGEEEYVLGDVDRPERTNGAGTV